MTLVVPIILVKSQIKPIFDGGRICQHLPATQRGIGAWRPSSRLCHKLMASASRIALLSSDASTAVEERRSTSRAEPSNIVKA